MTQATSPTPEIHFSQPPSSTLPCPAGPVPLPWQYLIVRLDSSRERSAVLNRHGAEGWELVSLLPHNTPGAVGCDAIFKRPQPRQSDLEAASFPGPPLSACPLSTETVAQLRAMCDQAPTLFEGLFAGEGGVAPILEHVTHADLSTLLGHPLSGAETAALQGKYPDLHEQLSHPALHPLIAQVQTDYPAVYYVLTDPAHASHARNLAAQECRRAD